VPCLGSSPAERAVQSNCAVATGLYMCLLLPGRHWENGVERVKPYQKRQMAHAPPCGSPSCTAPASGAQPMPGTLWHCSTMDNTFVGGCRSAEVWEGA
jgi:hypothetical protein